MSNHKIFYKYKLKHQKFGESTTTPQGHSETNNEETSIETSTNMNSQSIKQSQME